MCVCQSSENVSDLFGGAITDASATVCKIDQRKPTRNAYYDKEKELLLHNQNYYS
jgi:hypothetical protein